MPQHEVLFEDASNASQTRRDKDVDAMRVGSRNFKRISKLRHGQKLHMARGAVKSAIQKRKKRIVAANVES